MITPKDHIQQLHDYTPGKAIDDVRRQYNLKHVTKLASNENPWGCPVSENVLQQSVQTAMLYPSLNQPNLVMQLAKKHQVSPNQVILGNGSDEILQMLAIAYLSPGDNTVTASYTFSVYHHVSQLMNASCTTTPMSNYTYDTHQLMDVVSAKTKLLFIANPNNPTGTFLPYQDLDTLLSRLPSSVLVVLDEAYRDFITEEAINATESLLKHHRNVIILRTFSKAYGLAGFRVGYGIAHEPVINTLQKVRQPFNVNSIGLAAASIALEKTSFLEKTIQNNTHQRRYLTQAIQEMGFDVIPSQANFIAINVKQAAMDVHQGLLKKGFIVRPLDSFGLAQYIRVTIGTPEQNQRFITTFQKVIQELKEQNQN